MAIRVQSGSGGLAHVSEPEFPYGMTHTLTEGVVRMARVMSMRRTIARGDYRVSSSDLAVKLLRVLETHRQGQRYRWKT